MLSICVAAGLYARFYELGERQLAVDEYYFLESVGRILEQGVPALPGGGYYPRDLLAQYITAGSILLFGDTGFAQRLPVALFGLAAVALSFVYARPQLGRRLAVVLAGLLLVSSWEIEFSRFARMYAPFQCATLAFLIAYDRALLGDRWDRRYLAHAAAIAMVLSHTLGLFLLPLLFVPLLVTAGPPRFPTRAHAIRFALVSVGTLLASTAYARTDFMNWGVSDRYPSGFIPAGSSLLRLPDFPFWSAGGEPVASLMVLIAVLAVSAVAPATVSARRSSRHWAAAGLTGLLLSSAVLHSLIISAVCAALLLFRHEVYRSDQFSRGYRAALAAAALIATSWLAYALATRDWVSRSGDGMGSLIGALRRSFFGWPDFFTTILVPWAAALPGIGAFIALAVAHQLWTNRKQPLAILARNPALPILIVAIALGVLASGFYAGMRFTYFLYPVALYTVALSILQLAKGFLPRCAARAELIAGGLCLVLFALSSDFNPRHLIRVTQPDASFRIGAFEGRESTWYPRYDYASAAEFLEARARESQQMTIIVVGLPAASHYLDLDHAVFYPRGRTVFAGVSRDRGTRDLWSQRRLLSTAEELRDYTASAKTIRLVRLADATAQPFGVADVWQDRLVSVNQEFKSKDGRVEVVSVTLKLAIGEE